MILNRKRYMNKNDFVMAVVFLITLLLLNILRWVFFKYTKLNQPKYMYWYLFIISWLPIWKELVASLG
jgi:hypothetical protein